MKTPLPNAMFRSELKKLFPCSLCGEGLEVRESKRGKPYVVCNGCGMQMFVRTKEGIRKFEKLVGDAVENNIWGRLAELETRYKVQCPKCGKRFWASTKLIKTSWFSGLFVGYKCPEDDCDGVAKPEEQK